MSRVVVAEDVTAGHPDRIADALAETVVEAAQRSSRSAAVGVEVALFRRRVLVAGHLAVGRRGGVPGPDSLADVVDGWLAGLAGEVLDRAGYRGRWALPVEVTGELDIETLTPDVQAGQGYSCDQDVVVGHATPDDALGNLPVEVVAARAARDALGEMVLAEPDLLGPDGKVLVVVRHDGAAAVLDALNISVLHPAEVGYVDLYRVVAPAVLDRLAGVPGLRVPDRVDPSWCTINGAGPFLLAGPLGDGGLSGKKLVADLYGPSVPIGGGALCGKDAFKADRCGPLRARQLAVRLARATGLDATVRTGWFPGGTAPRFLSADLGDGRQLDAGSIDRLVGLPDLSIRGTVKDLELTDQPWSAHLRTGYVGAGHPWDQG